MGLVDGVEVLVANDPNEFIEAIVEGYTNEQLWNQLSRNGLSFVEENYSTAAVGSQLIRLVRSLDSGWPQIEGLNQFRSWEEWSRHNQRIPENTYIDREIYQQTLLPPESTSRTEFLTPGFCCVCQKETQFRTSGMFATANTAEGHTIPNWREHLQCVHCGLVNRVRAALHYLQSYTLTDEKARIYLPEQDSPAYNWLKTRYQNLTGSQHLGPRYRPGEIVRGIRNENLMNLSFPDRSFDRILVLDFLEHVPDHIAAFRELYRVLEDGGELIFSVPFSYDSKANIIRALKDSSGNIKHLLKPEFHGDSAAPDDSSLCFRYFGWEVLDQLRACGFTKAVANGYWSPRQGYLGREQFLFSAHR
jgi:SAM-dependent methyltransferase